MCVCVGVAIVGTGDTECIYVLRSREKDTVVRVVRANQVAKYSFSFCLFYIYFTFILHTLTQEAGAEMTIAMETVRVLALERRGGHPLRLPLRSQEDIEACEKLVTDWFREHDDLHTNDPDLADARECVENLEDRLSTFNTDITDATSHLVRVVSDLGGDTGAAEYGIYDGDDCIAKMFCARIADLEESEKV